MSEAINNAVSSLLEVSEVIPITPGSCTSIQDSSLLNNVEQVQDLTKPYRIAFKGKLANDECTGEK